eukprot:359050-Chlamydomonas_euryale.AAC.3
MASSTPSQKQLSLTTPIPPILETEKKACARHALPRTARGCPQPHSTTPNVGRVARIRYSQPLLWCPQPRRATLVRGHSQALNDFG